MTKNRQGINQSQLQILGSFGVFLTAKTLAENANKNYHTYKMIDDLHIYNTILGIRLIGYPAIKNKKLGLIKYRVLY